MKHILYVSVLVLFFSSCSSDFDNPVNKHQNYLYKDSLIFVAYSSLNHNYPINTLSHFIAAAKCGFNSLKADLRITKDSVLILCHDLGFTLDNNGRIINFDSHNYIPISDMMSDDVLALEINAFNKEMGYYEHPMSFEDFLILCDKLNVIPYITIRMEQQSSTLERLFKILKSYNKENTVILNIFPPKISTCQSIRNYYKTPICLTLNVGNYITYELISALDSIENLAICIYYDNLDSVSEIINILDEKGIGLYTWYVSNDSEYKKALALGCVGFQVDNADFFSNLSMP